MDSAEDSHSHAVPVGNQGDKQVVDVHSHAVAVDILDAVADIHVHLVAVGSQDEEVDGCNLEEDAHMPAGIHSLVAAVHMLQVVAGHMLQHMDLPVRVSLQMQHVGQASHKDRRVHKDRGLHNVELP